MMIERYLCDSEELKAQFCDNFLAGLRRLHASGELKLNGDWEHLQSKAAFNDWLKPLESVTWVAYIAPPPYDSCPPEQMAKYWLGISPEARFPTAASCRMKTVS